MAPPKTGAPSSKGPSRKSKASWRKAVDLADVEQALEDKRTRERLLGPSADEGSSSKDGPNVFTVDRKGDEQVHAQLAKKRDRERAGKRPLKSLQVLQERSAVPAVSTRARAGVSAPAKVDDAEQRLRRAGLGSKAARDKLRRIAHKKVRGPLGTIVESEQSRLQDVEGANVVADHDVWATEKRAGKRKALPDQDDDNEWIHIPRNRRAEEVKVPRTLAVTVGESSGSSTAVPSSTVSGASSHTMVALSRTLPAVPAPHPGTSYNPAAETHEELLRRAFEVERAKELDEEARRRFKRRWDELRQAEKDEIVESEQGSKLWRGMTVDDPDAAEADAEARAMGSSGEESAVEASTPAVASSDLDGAGAAAAASGKKEPKRKTAAARARAQRAKAEARAAAERKQAKRVQHLMTQAPALRKKLDAAQRARLQAAEERRAAKAARVAAHGMAGVRVGKASVARAEELHFNKDGVQLGEDLTEHLRGLKTEGNLFRDRFARMQARALVEPRTPVLPKKKRGTRGEKTYERHSYKQFV